jgi:cellobiose phosphorylase
MMADLILNLQQRGIRKLTFFRELELLLSDHPSLYDAVDEKQKLLHKYCDSCRSTLSGEYFEIPCEELAQNLKNKAAWIRNHILGTEWIENREGHSWYNGYYDNSGRRVEGDFETGVRMMLAGQVFAIMSGTASEEQIKAIVKAADAYLYDESIGGYKLNTDFHEVKEDLGRMFGFAYGHKENGAVFSHMVVMYSNALYQRGFVKEGYKAINTLYRHCSDFEKSRIYPGIPEYIGDNGRGLYHYLTGSASWLLLTVLTEMFGVKGAMGDLQLEPKLLGEQFDQQGLAEVSLIFAGRKLTICYENKGMKDYGNYYISKVLLNKNSYEANDGTYIIRRQDIEALAKDEVHRILVELS